MPRRARSIQGGLVYHVLNRSNGRQPPFRKEADYAAFERVIEEAHVREPLRILAYCVRPNYGTRWCGQNREPTGRCPSFSAG